MNYTLTDLARILILGVSLLAISACTETITSGLPDSAGVTLHPYMESSEPDSVRNDF